jgi:hypothetical protein
MVAKRLIPVVQMLIFELLKPKSNTVVRDHPLNCVNDSSYISFLGLLQPKATPPEATLPNYIRSVRILVCLSVLVASVPLAVAAPGSDDKPNIVLVLMDNFGYGEIGVYGGGVLRGAPTPRIDSIAAEGFQLTNFNVEAESVRRRVPR